MKTALYIRVSTEEQALEGYSISAQKQRLKAYCIAQDWDVYGLYVDEGISAKDMNRPELQRMISDIKNGEIECVLVYRLDRLTRSVLDLYKLLETFEQNNCKFKSATEVYDTTTAIGRLFITLVAALAQWERENMGERIRMGYQEKTRQGKYASNNRPYGYNLSKDGTLTVNEEEAKVVREIFDMYLKGIGSRAICLKLNDRGIRTRTGGFWNQIGISYIIKNPVYMGTLRWNKSEQNPIFVENAVDEPIIDQHSFKKANEIIALKAKMHPKGAGSNYIYSGILKCPECGGPMTGYPVYYKSPKTGEKITYKNYRCRRKKDGHCEGSKTLSENKLNEFIIGILSDMDTQKALQKFSSEFAYTEEFNSQDEIDRINNELSKIEKRKKKWQYAWSDEFITDKEFRERMSEERRLEEELNNELEELKPSVDDDNTNVDISLIIRNIKDNWEYLNDQEKKTLLQLTFEKIVVRNDKSVYSLEELVFA